MDLTKAGVRVLGVAESFVKEREHSILAGIVMRGDLQIDGIGIARIKVGGMDATDGVFSILSSLQRKDINVIFFGGCIISWFNIIDISRIHQDTGLPSICITYQESEGLEKYFSEYFPGDEERKNLYKKLGPREKIKLGTGHEIFARWIGMKKMEAKLLLNRFTLHGKIPEPVRVARLLARTLRDIL
jgi:hypothetical protein